MCLNNEIDNSHRSKISWLHAYRKRNSLSNIMPTNSRNIEKLSQISYALCSTKFITRYFSMIPFNMSGILHCKLSVVWLMLVISGSNGALGTGNRIVYNIFSINATLLHLCITNYKNLLSFSVRIITRSENGPKSSIIVPALTDT